MRYVVGAVVLLFTLRLAVSMVRGRARLRSCCPADPAKDRRMQP